VQLSVADSSGATIAKDRATLWLDERAESGWDPFEATDMAPPVSDGYATAAFPIQRSDGSVVDRMQAAAPYPSGDSVITKPLSVAGKNLTGTATLAWPEDTEGQVPDEWIVQLVDTKTGETVDLRSSDYTFDIGTDKSTSDPRFRLKVDVTGSILPVELAGFEGRTIENGVRLQWRTASEQNNAGFAIERKPASAGAGAWTQIGFREGAGTTEEATAYQFVDEQLPFTAEEVTYRLRQKDLDGGSSYSEPVTVSLGAPEALRLHAPFPNPTREQATLRLEVPERQEVRVGVYDVLGRKTATVVDGFQAAGRKELSFDTSQLSPGVYFLRLEAGSTVQTRKLTVVR
jgi:hypothetical protein